MSISSLSQRFSNYFLGPVDRYLFTEKLRSDSNFKDQFNSFQHRIIEIVITRQDTGNHEDPCRTVCDFIDGIIANRYHHTNDNPLYEALTGDKSLKEKIKGLFPDGKNIHKINAQDLKDRLKTQIEAYSNPRNFSYFSSKLNEAYKNKFYDRLQDLIKNSTKKYDLSKIEITLTKFLASQKIGVFKLKDQPLIDTSDCDDTLFQELLVLDINEFFPSFISQENFESRASNLISYIATPKFIEKIVEWKKTTLIESIKSKITELKRAGAYDFNQIKNTLECFFQKLTEQTNTDNINQEFLDDLTQNHGNDLAQILEHSEPDFKETASTYFMLEILTPDHKKLPKQEAEFLDQIRTEVTNRLNQNNCTSLQLKNALLHFFADMNPTKKNDELPEDFDHPFYNFLRQYQSKLFNIINQNSLDDINMVASELCEKSLKLVDIESKKIIQKPILDIKEKINKAKTVYELEIIQNSFDKFINRYKLKLDPNNIELEDYYNNTYIHDGKKVTTDPNLLNTLIHAYSDISLSIPDLEEISSEINTFIKEKIKEAKNNKKEKTLEFEGDFFHEINKEIAIYCNREISTDILTATLKKFFEIEKIITENPNWNQEDNDHLYQIKSICGDINKDLLHALYKKHLKTLSLILRQKTSESEAKYYQEILLKFQKLNPYYIQKIENYNYKKILEIIYKFKDLEPNQKELFWSTMQMLSKKYSNLGPEAIWHFIDHVFSMPDQEKQQYWLTRVQATEVDDDGYAVKTEEDRFYLSDLKTRAENLKEKSEEIFKTRSGKALLDFLDQREMSSKLNIQYKEFLTKGVLLFEQSYKIEFGYQKVLDQQKKHHLEINLFFGQTLFVLGNYDTNRTPIPEIVYKILSYRERGLLEEIRGFLWATVMLINNIYTMKCMEDKENPNMKVQKEINTLRTDNAFIEKVLEFIRERRTINQESNISDADQKIIMEFFYNQPSNKAF